MDAIDQNILNILQKNARETVKQMAEECFISSPSVSVRLQNLESRGFIDSYQAMLNYQKIGFSVKAYIHCAVNAKDKSEFYAFIQDVPNVTECDCITGEYSMMLKVFFPNTNDLDEFINHLQQFGNTKTNIVFSTHVGPRGLTLSEKDVNHSKQK